MITSPSVASIDGLPADLPTQLRLQVFLSLLGAEGTVDAAATLADRLLGVGEDWPTGEAG